MQKIFTYLFGDINFDQLQAQLILTSILILTGIILTRVSRIIISKILKNRFLKHRALSKKQETIMNLIQNLIKYFIWFIVLIGILKVFKVNTDAILTSAGILGVAIGFGAQSFVKDLIAGVFIIFEDQFSIGDVIETNGFMGEVMEIGLKSTWVKKWTGEIKIVANGNIGDVINYSKNNAIAIVDISLPVTTDLQEVENLISDLLPTLPSKYKEMVQEPEILGVNQINDSIIQYRITVEVLPMEQFGIQRVLYREILDLLDANQIDVAIRQLHIHTGDK